MEVSISIISDFKDDFYISNENAENLFDNVEDLKIKIDIMLKETMKEHSFR